MAGTKYQTTPPLRWEHLNAHVAAQVNAHIMPVPRVEGGTAQGPVQTHSNPPTELGLGGSAVAAGFAAAIVLLYACICFHLTGPAATFLLASLPVGAFGLCLAPPRVAHGTRKSARPRGPLVADERLREAFTEAAQTRAESVYGEIILLLAQQRGNRQTLGLRRDLLRECNALLATHLGIARETARVRSLIGESAPARPQAEHADLAARLQAQTDPVTRNAYETSLALCEERLQATNDLPTLLARLEAHDEIICQALLLARATLTRIEAAPAALTPPDVAALRQTVRHALHQTQAEEELKS